MAANGKRCCALCRGTNHSLIRCTHHSITTAIVQIREFTALPKIHNSILVFLDFARGTSTPLLKYLAKHFGNTRGLTETRANCVQYLQNYIFPLIFNVIDEKQVEEVYNAIKEMSILMQEICQTTPSMINQLFTTQNLKDILKYHAVYSTGTKSDIVRSVKNTF